MADIGIREKMFIRDVMSSPVITVREDETVEKVAQLMEKYGFGCMIVTSKDGKPLGIITERDLDGKGSHEFPPNHHKSRCKDKRSRKDDEQT